jgi:hypothetical protein
MSNRTGASVRITTDERSNNPSSKNFVARSQEQAKWSDLLRGLVGPKRGLLSTVLLGNAAPKQSKVETPSKSHLVLISGSSGVGKTSLALRLRDTAQHDKEFTRRFRTTRLDWSEARERASDLAAILVGQLIPFPVLLDLLHNHLEREDFLPYLEEYQRACDETAKLRQTVQGAELEAVWEYRAKALGRCLKLISGEKPLLFFMDTCDVLAASITMLHPIFEESGSLVVWVLTGESLGALEQWEQIFAPTRLLSLPLTAFSPEETRHFLEVELSRYVAKKEAVPTATPPIYKSPSQVLSLTELSAGLPLGLRILVYMLESGLKLEELVSSAVEPSSEINWLLNRLLSDLLGPGHPDYLKIYAFGLLRRPERGLLAALLDLHQDMLPINEILQRLNARYEFIFEPNRQMRLHTALERPLRLWIQSPERAHDPGFGRMKQRALSYLEERLRDWGQTFKGLSSKMSDVKWTE